MKSINHFFIAVLYILASYSYQVIAQNLDPESPAQLILRDFERNNSIKTLSRDIWTYHWFFSSLKKKDTPLAFLQWKASAWNTRIPNDQGTIGIGLYTAYDPIDTKSYGDSLAKIEITKGTRFLDLREQEIKAYVEIKVSKDTVKKLKLYGCDLEYDNLVKQKWTDDPECHSYLLEAFKLGEIGFISYRLIGGVSKKFCNYKGRLSTAFIMANYKVDETNTSFLRASKAKQELRDDNSYETKIFGCKSSLFPEDDYKVIDF